MVVTTINSSEIVLTCTNCARFRERGPHNEGSMDWLRQWVTGKKTFFKEFSGRSLRIFMDEWIKKNLVISWGLKISLDIL